MSTQPPSLESRLSTQETLNAALHARIEQVAGEVKQVQLGASLDAKHIRHYPD
jgi:hypothetical protein